MEFPQQFICATKEYTTYQRFVPAPYFRKTFTAGSAGCRLRVTGLGFYRVWINGRELTKGLLAPYISNPDALVYFDDYDLTPYLRPNAENTLGFQLGNGMLNAPGGATWDFDKAPFRAAPKLAFLLETGGVRIEADSSVRTAPSPLYFDDLRAGVRYDARREIAGWNLPEFDDSGWAHALLCPAPRGEFRVCAADPIVQTGPAVRAVLIRPGRLRNYSPRDDVEQVNGEMLAFARTYGRYENHGAVMYHGAKRGAAGAALGLIKVDKAFRPDVKTSDPLLCGCFSEKDGSGKAFVFTNMYEPETGSSAAFSATFTGAKSLTVYRKGEPTKMEGETLTLTLENREGVFVTVEY